MPPEGLAEDHHPAAADEPKERDLLEFADVVRFARRHWVVIALFAVGFATMAGFVLSLLPPSYEASATLVVIPPRFSSDLKPKPLSIQGYQRLLESDGVVTETFHRLIAKKVLSTDASLRVGDELDSRIFVSRRAEETALAPVIEAVGHGKTPEAAAAVANTWTEVFLERSRQLTAGSVQPTAKFIEDQFGGARKSLESLGKKRVQAADDFERRSADASTRWDRTLEEASNRWNRQLVGYQKETEDLVAQYQSESRRTIEQFAAENGVLRRGPDPAPADSGAPLSSASEPVRQRLLEMVSLRTQLAQTPRFLVLEKAISDDALWQVMALGQSQLLELQNLPAKNLLSQEVNPVYSELTLRLSRVELHPELLSAENRHEARSFSAELEGLQRSRSAGLSKLIADRATELDSMQKQKHLEIEELRRKKEQELDSLSRRRDLRLGEFDRDLSHAQDLFNELASNYNEAELARAIEGVDMEDVRLGSPAVPSLQPTPRLLPLKVLAALVLGGLFGIVVALWREVG